MSTDPTAPPPGKERSLWPRVGRDLAGLLAVAGVLTLVVSPESPPLQEGPERSLPAHPEPLRPRAGPVRVRAPAVAGTFYPAAPAALYEDVGRMLASSPPAGLRRTRAILVPHAGYAYSGEVAAASFREVGHDFRRVFILAANHNGDADFAGVSIPDATHYRIPGADIPLSAVADELRLDPLFVHEPAAHKMHMIEVELPFLHFLRGRPATADFEIVPMILGRMETPQIQRLAQILDAYVGSEALFVFSADLSHYYRDEEARRLDAEAIQAVMSLDPAALARARTDGNQVLRTMVALAGRRGWEPSLLRYRNSGDVSGDRSRVVGYGAIALTDPLRLTHAEEQALLSLARRAIEAKVHHEPAPAAAELLSEHPVFRIPRGVFVTLKKDGQLRGCIGRLVASGPLYESVLSCAVDAALHDERFEPVTADELDDLSVSISILDFPRLVRVEEPAQRVQALRPHRDGAILVSGGRRSTYLPSVWESIPAPREFLSRLCLKQGSPPDCWLDPATSLYRYSAYEITEIETGAGVHAAAPCDTCCPPGRNTDSTAALIVTQEE